MALLFVVVSLQAQVTIIYDPDENDANNYDTSAPNDPTTLSVASGTATQTGVVSGTGDVIKAGAGSLNLIGVNTYTGETRISEGMLRILSDNNLGVGGDLVLDGGILNNIGVFSMSRNLRLGAGNGTIQTNGGDQLIISGVISADGSLTKTGDGVLTLSGDNTYTGGSTISAGTLRVGAGGPTGTIGNGFDGAIVNNGNLLFNRTGTLNVWNGISGTGDVTQSGSGTTVLAQTLDYTGSTTVTNGTLQIGEQFFLTTFNGDVVNNSALVFHTPRSMTYSGQIFGLGSVTVTATFGDSLENQTIILAGNNSYTGGTTILDGKIVISSDSNLGDASSGITFYEGVLQTTSSFAMNRDFELTEDLDSFDTAFIETDEGTTLTYGGAISGGGNLSKFGEGTLILTEDSTFANPLLTNGLRVFEGSLVVENAEINHGSTLRVEGGDVIVQNGGFLNSGGRGEIRGDGGSVTVTGSGSRWESASRIEVKGFPGPAVFDVEAGGVVQAFSIEIGDSSSFEGSVTVTGSGSMMEAESGLDIGDFGTGTLNIENGGIASSSSTILARNGGTGSLNLTGGTLATGHVSESSGSGTVTYDNGTLQLTDAQNNLFDGFEAGDITLDAGGLTIDTQSFNIGTTAQLSGTGGLTKVGSGNLTLRGLNAYTGDTVINEGVLTIRPFVIGDTTTGDIVNNAVLSYVLEFGGDMNESSDISGTGALHVDIPGDRVLTLSGNSTYSGGTFLNNGELSVGADTNLGAPTGELTFDDAILRTTGSFTANRDTTINLSGSVNDAFIITNAGTTLTHGGAITGEGNLIKRGEGTLILTGISSFSTAQHSAGGIGLQQGTLVVDDGSVDLNSEEIQVGSNVLSGVEALIVRNGGTLLTHGGQIGATSDVTITGAGSEWYTGLGASSGAVVLAADAGTLTIENGGSLRTVQVREDSGSGTVTFDSGTLQLNDNQGGLFNGFEMGDVMMAAGGGTIDTQGFNVSTNLPLTGSGGLTKVGTGVLTLNGASTYSGDTTVAEGTLRVNNTSGSGTGTGDVMVDSTATLAGDGSIAGGVTIANGATASPGNSAGELTVGSLVLNDTSQLDFELLDPLGVAGTDNDLITVLGDLTLDGVLNFNEGCPAPVGVYTLMTYTGSLIDNTLELDQQFPELAMEISTATPGEVRLIVVEDPDNFFADSFETIVETRGCRAPD